MRHVPLVAVVLPLFAAAMTSSSLQFRDVPAGAWFAPYVDQAVNAGIVSGYEDRNGHPTGDFGPENSVTVGEALKIALEGAGYDTSLGVGYGHWAAQYMSVALGEHFEFALRNPQVNLDRPASRAEVASLMADAFHVGWKADTVIPENFTDVDINNQSHYPEAINKLLQDEIVSGDNRTCIVWVNTTCPRTTFRPLSPINRAETVKITMLARATYGSPGRSPHSSSVSSRSSSLSSSSCSLQDCGLAPGMPNWQCPNGSIAGPSCERLPDHRCGWLIRQCPVGSSSSLRSSSSSAQAVQTFIVQYTDTGFQPSFLSVRVGDTVKFRNQSSLGMWVASNPHPTHGEYPEFDQRTSVGAGGEFSFRFSKVGAWGFHNHLNPGHQAVVSVDQR